MLLVVPASVGGLEALWSPLCIVGSPRIVAFIVVTRVLNIINVSLVASVKGGDTAANVSQEWQSNIFRRHSKHEKLLKY